MCEYATPDPVVTPTAYGRCMAMSPRGSRFRIGVVGATENVARQKFFQSYEKWQSYFVQPLEYHI